MSSPEHVERLLVGSTEVFALLDGVEDYLPMTTAFPDADADELLSYRREHPGLYGPLETWRLVVRAWILRSAGRVMLVDTGVGSAVAPAWFGASGELMVRLEEVGVDSREIETVVLTHIHDDHIGGLVDADGSLRFQNARHLLQRADRDRAHRSAAADDATESDRSIVDVLLGPLESSGRLDLVDGDRSLDQHIRLRHLPGHTPGHQVVEVDGGTTHLVIAGDTFNHPAQLTHPDWTNAADDDPALAAASRRALLAELTERPSTIIAAAHFVEAFGTVEIRDAIARWSPIAPDTSMGTRSALFHGEP
ncbi:MAG: MBL fold metallo-hydrolase [Actinobacteria bacterium]|nr:MBL fold metallo-hydrolase [Actinomycetota bacterium]